jgi:hypothetical protein
MDRTFTLLSRTYAAATTVFAGVLSALTVGAVVALFATAMPSETVARVVMEPIVITAHKLA